MFQRQEPTPALLDQHIRELQEALTVIDALLHKASYQPGASWVATLPLDSEGADPPAHRTLVGFYAEHVRAVAARARSTEAGSGSISDAIQRALSAQAGARDPAHAQIVKDALVVTSVAIRMAAEALSLATVIVLESAALAGPSSSQWLKDAPDTAELADALPRHVRKVYRQLDDTKTDLESLFEQLSRLTPGGVDLDETLAFEYDEGLLDDVVGIAWDSIHVDLQAGAEALFYTALDDPESSGGSGETFDYTGRLTKLEYEVEPIVLASVRLSLKVDWPHWAEALGLDLDYATNRIYKSGGDIENSSLARELGVSSSVSDALNAALAVAGVRASVKVAHFNHGIVRDVLVADGSLLAEAPLTFDMKQIDLAYDFAGKRGGILQTLAVGLRYFDYELPRVLYEFENVTPGEDSATYVYVRETPPQAMRTRYYMGTVTARIEKPVTSHLTPYASLDLGIGYGPTSYFFLIDDSGANEPSNHEETSTSSVGIGVAGVLGCRLLFAGPSAPFNGFLDVRYHAQSIHSIFEDQDDDTTVRIGVTDIFHGPTAALGATF